MGFDQNIGRLDIPVNDILAVGVVQRVQNLMTILMTSAVGKGASKAVCAGASFGLPEKAADLPPIAS